MADHKEEEFSKYIFCQIEDGTVLVVDRYGPSFQRLTSKFEVPVNPYMRCLDKKDE